jgi:GNAT superfamily N-acetyltransferase
VSVSYEIEAVPTAADRPQPDGSDIRKMVADEVDAVARTLAHAFYDDPHFRWIVRNDSIRMRRMVSGFATFIGRIWLPHDEGFVHERLIGAAIWMPPDTWHTSLFAQLRLLPSILRNVGADSGRLLKAVTWMEKKHPREPHWYLPAIGMTPAWQGRGYGAALLRPMLERCDAERMPAYLEASTPRNRALYERHGFELIEEARYASDAPPLFRMWREPKP